MTPYPATTISCTPVEKGSQNFASFKQYRVNLVSVSVLNYKINELFKVNYLSLSISLCLMCKIIFLSYNKKKIMDNNNYFLNYFCFNFSSTVFFSKKFTFFIFSFLLHSHICIQIITNLKFITH